MQRVVGLARGWACSSGMSFRACRGWNAEVERIGEGSLSTAVAVVGGIVGRDCRRSCRRIARFGRVGGRGRIGCIEGRVRMAVVVIRWSWVRRGSLGGWRLEMWRRLVIGEAEGKYRYAGDWLKRCCC